MASGTSGVLGVADITRGIALGAAVLLADAALKLVARAGGCSPAPAGIGLAELQGLWSIPANCSGTAMAGPAVVLVPRTRDGLIGGALAGQLDGVQGQLVALGLLALVTILTVLVARWAWRSGADALALGLVGGGAVAHALARFVHGGAGLTELDLGGIGVGVPDLAVAWGCVWLVWRWIAELRA
jgi:hypothetical protein